MTEDLRIDVAIANLNKAVSDINRLGAATNSTFSGIDRKVSQTKTGFRDFGNQIPGISRALNTLASPLTVAGAGIALLGTQFTKAVRTFAQFEQQLSRTGSIVTAGRSAQFTAIAYEKLESAARQLGASSVFTAQQVAEAQQFLAQAGFNTGQILDATEATLNLAASASIDLGKAADIASNVLSQFGKDASELNEVVDILTATTSSANTNVSQLAEAFKFIGPTAAALNVDLTEVSAAVGLLGNSGIQGSLAGRALGTSLANLAAPTGRAKTEIERLGLTFFNTRGEFVGLAGVVEELERALDGVTDQQRVATLSNVFGAEALQEISTLYNEGSENIRKYTEELDKATGIAQQVAEQRLDNLAGSVTKLNSAFQELQIAIGGSQGGVFRALTDSTTGLLQALSQVTQSEGFFRGLADFFTSGGSGTNILALAGGGVLDELIENQQIARGGFEGLTKSVIDFVEEFSISPELVSFGEIENIQRRINIALDQGSITADQYRSIMAQVDVVAKAFADSQADLAEAVEGAGAQSAVAANSMKALQEQLAEVNRLISVADPDSPLFSSLVLQAQELEDQIDEIKAKIERLKLGDISGINIESIDTSGLVLPELSSAINFDVQNIEALTSEALRGFDPLIDAAQRLGVDLDFVLNNFENLGDLSETVNSNFFRLGTVFTDTTEKALQFALSMQQVRDTVVQGLANVGVNALEKFGNAAGLALRGAATAGQALQSAFQSLVQGLLVEVPKLIGIALIQAGIATTPIGIPLVIAGAALVGLSGLLGGLTSSSTASTSPLASGGGAALRTSIVGGLGTQAQAQNLIENNLTIVLETDGITREVVDYIVREEENKNGG